MPGWAVAATAAAAIALVVTPAMRYVALRTGVVDRPAAHKVHAAPVPYLGGVAIMVAALVAVALATEPSMDGAVVVVLAAGTMLGLVGLADDILQLGAATRLIPQAAAAAAALAAGVVVEASGVAIVDGALTLLWIVGITNAFNMADNMDGLSGGIAVAIGGGMVAIMVHGDQVIASSIAGALAGAAAGYLVWNLSPRRVFMGDAGSMFLGYVIAVAAVEAVSLGGPRRSALTSLVLLVGVLLLDSATVVAGRYTHGKGVMSGGKDHLSHRLAARGLHPRSAVAVLVALQGALATLAVAVARDALAAWWGLAAGVALTAIVGIAVLSVPVYDSPPIEQRRRRVRLGVAAAAVAAGLWLALAGGGSVGPPETLVAGDSGTAAWGSLVILAAVAMVATLVAATYRARGRTQPAMRNR